MKSDLQAKKEVNKAVRKSSKTASLAVPKKSTKKTSQKEEVTTIASDRLPKKRKTAKSISTEPKATKTVSRAKKPLVATTEPEAVKLPSSASLRLLEKVELYRLWYLNSFPKEVSRFAKISGYCFILLGTALSLYGYFSSSRLGDMAAATVCSDMDCVEIADDNLAPTAPLVTFLNSLPSEITKDTDLTLRSRDGQEPAVFVRAIQSGVTTTLVPTDKLANGEYRYLIETAKIGSGFFEVIAKVADSNKLYTFSGPTFTVGGLSYTEHRVGETKSDLSTSSSTATSSDSSAEVEEATPDELPQDESPILISVEEASDSYFVKVKTGTYRPESVELKAKVEGTSPVITLGATTLIQGEWLFSLSALSLPDTHYELYAQFESQGRMYLSPIIKFSPKQKDKINLASDDDISLLVGKINLALETAEVNNQTRKAYYSHIASTTPNYFDRAHELSFTTKQVSDRADEVLLQEINSIDALLYKHALISGSNNFLADLANYQRDALAKQLARNYSSGASYTSLETVITGRLIALQNLVAEMEDKIADETRSLTETDTDMDGLSDYDELANTNTDPASADSDNDSVIDSIEILDGTNPSSADLVRFPDEHSLRINTQSSPVTLRSVRAVSQVHGDTTLTYPLIEGTGIPNSYVFIFVSGRKTPGIIKTGSDGRFEYTFEQKFLDATYEVRAGMITGRGEIIGETRPLTFTKKSDTLAASALFSEGYVLENSDQRSNVPYIVAGSILLVTFGFVLVLLALSLIPRRREATVKH